MLRAEAISKIRRGNLLRIIYIGVCFMLILTAQNSGMNMMSEIFVRMGYQNLTQICFSVEYFLLILTSFLSSYYVNKVSNKVWLILGAISNGVFVSGGALATYCYKYNPETFICDAPFIYSYNIFAVGSLGLLGTIFWTCEGVYVNKCADEKTRGMYNGIFLSLMQSSQLWSGIVSTTILGYTDEFTFYLVILGICAVAIMMISLLPKPLDYPVGIEGVPKKSTESLWVFIKKFVSETLLNKKYGFLFCGMIFSGVTIGFFPNYLGTTVSYTIKGLPQNIVEERIGFVFFILAIGEISAGLIIGKLTQKFHKVSMLCFAFIVGEIAIIVTFLSDYLVSYEVAIGSGFLWGFCDNATQTVLMVVIGSEFNSRPELYASYNMFQGIGAISISGLTILMSGLSPLYLIALIGGLILSVQCMLYFCLPKRVRDEDEIEQSFITTQSLNV